MATNVSKSTKSQTKFRASDKKAVIIFAVIVLLIGSGTLFVVSHPYLGWKTASLRYEKQTVRYPKSWIVVQLQENRYIPSGNDMLGIQSPDKRLMVQFTTGYVAPDFSKQTYIRDSKPLQVLGKQYYLGTIQSDGRLVNAALELVNWTDKSGVPNRYAASNYTCQKAKINPCKVTSLVTVSMSGSGQPVSDYYNNKYYGQARQIIESLSY